MKSIYVSIPSMKDEEYFHTLKSCYENRSGEYEIHIGSAYNVLFNNKKVIDDVKSKIPDIPNLQVKFINSSKNRGVGYGRLESASFYNNEDYFMQCDSHTLFLKDWDKILVNSLNESKIYLDLEKVIITGYAAGYEFIQKNERLPLDNSTPMYPYFISDSTPGNPLSIWTDKSKIYKACIDLPKWYTPRDRSEYDFVKNKYELCTKINANFLFSDREFALNYKKLFPWEFIFFEEEIVMTIESFKMGYVPVFPNFETNICHCYVDNFNEFYSEREQLQFDDEFLSKIKYNIRNYYKENKNMVEKYFNYVKIDLSTKMALEEKYIPKKEDIPYEN